MRVLQAARFSSTTRLPSVTKCISAIWLPPNMMLVCGIYLPRGALQLWGIYMLRRLPPVLWCRSSASCSLTMRFPHHAMCSSTMRVLPVPRFSPASRCSSTMRLPPVPRCSSAARLLPAVKCITGTGLQVAVLWESLRGGCAVRVLVRLLLVADYGCCDVHNEKRIPPLCEDLCYDVLWIVY